MLKSNPEDIKKFTEEKFPELKVQKGVLYIVSTPIGNMEDISFRALFVLRNVDLIAAEDTRVTNNLLKHYGIRNSIISYYSKVEFSKVESILTELENNKSVALVSDAGTPCISDPGNILVSECIEREIEIVSIPGASSLIHSMVLSGFPNERFYFHGFLPQKKGREKTLNELKQKKMTLIIFESKYRIRRTLNDCLKHFGNKEISIGRELTKKFEENVRGRLKEINSRKNIIKEKGEFVIVINNNQ
jgi:16S rRNA (cytidine1402-2'-O)-methyltransferase